jgi:hypothetical protein
MPINNGIINQKGTPAFYSDIFANRPAFGYAGRVFISTDTGAIYEDTGTSWTLIADAGAGTTGTLQQVTTNGNTTTLGIEVQGLTIGKGAGAIASNTAIGNLALNSNTTGSGITAIGSSALQNNTTGQNNIGIGANSLFANTTGGNNIGIGADSLIANTTASQNTAVGSFSLKANTTGNSNTALGYNSLTANTTGAQNTAIGNQTLSTSVSASNNVAIGYQSLYLNTTGASQTAVGSGSLQNNTTGANNTAIGSGTLTLNTTGINNTAIGQSSLAANLTGSYNVALGVGTLGNNLGSYNVGIGHSSLNAVTTGTNNSAIGYASGSAITTGSNNTIIGGYGGTTTLASNIVLSDGAGNVRLFSDANGLIAINQSVGSVPGGQLDIHTTQTYALVLNGLTTNNAYTAFSNNNVGKWRIGNTYNAGANSFDIFNLGTSSNALSFNSTTNAATLIAGLNGTTATFSSNLTLSNGALLINKSNGNAQIYFQNNGSNDWDLGTQVGDGTQNFALYNRGTSSQAFYINKSNNNAIFSTSVTSSGGGFIANMASTQTPALLIDRTSTAYNGIIKFTTGGTDKWILGNRNTSDETFSLYNYNVGANVFTITNSANILVGTTTDDTINKLQVSGSIKSSSLNTNSGDIGVVDTAIFYTGFTITSPGMYLVWSRLPAGGGDINYTANCVIISDGGAARIANLTGVSCSIQLSGLNVQFNQSSGAQQGSLLWYYQKIGI